MHLWLAIICHNIIYINLENKTLVLVHDHSRNLVLVHDCSRVRNIYCTLLWSKLTILDMDFYGWIFCWNLEFLSNLSHSFQGFYISFRKEVACMKNFWLPLGEVQLLSHFVVLARENDESQLVIFSVLT